MCIHGVCVCVYICRLGTLPRQSNRESTQSTFTAYSHVCRFLNCNASLLACFCVVPTSLAPSCFKFTIHSFVHSFINWVYTLPFRWAFLPTLHCITVYILLQSVAMMCLSLVR
uniref:Uncharacterized protein n=1 Tax=Trypanosoma vivax (strain Y486) TaxID=1055687 RepID=G0U9W3_TRYVY|nr:hypothetical protein TVY486_1100790 [Trypanosoma vivax Y486]